MDLVGRKDGRVIAVEVETGKSDVVGNVRRDLLEGFDQVHVVATSKVALREVEKELGKGGLLAPMRLTARFELGGKYSRT